MPACSEGLELSPACGQYTLQLHFKIRPKCWVPVWSDSPGQNWVHCLCIHPPSWPSQHLFLSYGETFFCGYTHTGTRTRTYKHRCLFSIGKMVSNWRAGLFYHLIHFIELEFDRHHWLIWKPPVHRRVNRVSAQGSRQGCTTEQPKVFSVAFVVDFENKQMCIDVKQSKNSIQAYWLFHT